MSTTPKFKPRRVYMYIDGYNLFYGQLRGKDSKGVKWLDLSAFGKQFSGHDSLLRVRYFTAKASALPGDPGLPDRQERYLRALRTSPDVRTHFGSFLTNPRMRPRVEPVKLADGKIEKWANILETNEKGSDVNLASYLLLDAFRDRFDVAYVVSNDSDLCEPIRMVRDRFEKVVGWVNPHGPKNKSAELNNVKSFYREVKNDAVLQKCQYPLKLKDKSGEFECPKEWAIQTLETVTASLNAKFHNK